MININAVPSTAVHIYSFFTQGFVLLIPIALTNACVSNSLGIITNKIKILLATYYPLITYLTTVINVPDHIYHIMYCLHLRLLVFDSTRRVFK